MNEQAFEAGREYERNRTLDCTTCDITLQWKQVINYTITQGYYSKKFLVSNSQLRKLCKATSYNKKVIVSFLLLKLREILGDCNYKVCYNKVNFEGYYFEVTKMMA